MDLGSIFVGLEVDVTLSLTLRCINWLFLFDSCSIKIGANLPTEIADLVNYLKNFDRR